MRSVAPAGSFFERPGTIRPADQDEVVAARELRRVANVERVLVSLPRQELFAVELPGLRVSGVFDGAAQLGQLPAGLLRFFSILPKIRPLGLGLKLGSIFARLIKVKVTPTSR